MEHVDSALNFTLTPLPLASTYVFTSRRAIGLESALEGIRVVPVSYAPHNTILLWANIPRRGEGLQEALLKAQPLSVTTASSGTLYGAESPRGRSLGEQSTGSVPLQKGAIVLAGDILRRRLFSHIACSAV